MKRSNAAVGLVTNVGLLLAGAASLFSGLLLQIGYHLHAAEGSRRVLSLGFDDWSSLHKLSITAVTLLVAIHLLRHRSWYASLLRRRCFRRRGGTAALTLLFVVTAITGGLPWGIHAAGDGETIRRALIEVHDKLALVLGAFLVVHVSKRIHRFKGPRLSRQR